MLWPTGEGTQIASKPNEFRVFGRALLGVIYHETVPTCQILLKAKGGKRRKDVDH